MRFGKIKPENMTPLTWELVVNAWENGLSDREAAFYASLKGDTEISAEELRQICKDYPEVGELKANLQSALCSEAKLAVADSLRDRDVKTAKWYLERKAADEFSTKQAVAFEGAAIELSLEDKEKKLKEIVENFEVDGDRD